MSDINSNNLIEWCEQYLTADGVFFDIGSNLGAYSVILSKKCKKVYAFESDPAVFERLKLTLTKNDCLNVDRFYVDSYAHVFAGAKVRLLDGYHIQNVQFLKFEFDHLDIFMGATEFLLDNNFPPFIVKITSNPDILTYIRDLGYQTHQIAGFPNIYLAGDHDNYQGKFKKEEPLGEAALDIITDMCNQDNFSNGFIIKSEQTIEELLDLYENNKLKDAGFEGVSWDIYHRLSKHYRIHSKHQKSYDCAIEAFKTIPKDKRELLDEEISIVAYYLGKHDEGYDACENLILSFRTSWSLKNSTLNNQSWYMKKLPFSKVIEVNYKLPTDYIGSSSSILPDRDEFILNLRGVNYSINERGGYHIRDPQGFVRTRNFLLKLDPELNIKNGIELVDSSGIKTYPVNIKGLEDIRLFGDNELFCTYLEINDSRTPQVCYCRYDSETGDVISVLPMQISPKLQCEKNWMPFIKDGAVHFIYYVDPLKIYKLHEPLGGADLGEVELVKNISLSKLDLGCFRGSSGLIPHHNGYLCTIHQVYHSDPRKYFHRFVWFDYDFNTIKYSRVFFFEKPQIEFNLSICHSAMGLLMPYSVNDNCSKIGILSYDTLDQLLGF